MSKVIYKYRVGDKVSFTPKDEWNVQVVKFAKKFGYTPEYNKERFPKELNTVTITNRSNRFKKYPCYNIKEIKFYYYREFELVQSLLEKLKML